MGRFLAAPDSNLRAASFLRSRFVRLSDAALLALAPNLADALTGPVGETAQHRRGVPGVGVPIRKEPAIEDENAAYLRPIRGFASL